MCNVYPVELHSVLRLGLLHGRGLDSAMFSLPGFIVLLNQEQEEREPENRALFYNPQTGAALESGTGGAMGVSRKIPVMFGPESP